MANRFGRNQRRRMREALTSAEQQRVALERRAVRAESRVATAYEDGMTHLLQTRYLEEAVRTISERLAREMSPELAKEAQRILNASKSERRATALVDLRAVSDLMDASVTVLEVRMPPVYCRVALHPGW
jgi:hypothetical protein